MAAAKSRLAELSNLDSADLVLWQRLWPAVEPERRRQTVQQLIDLAEDNLELNFDGIFKFCLHDEDAEVRAGAIEGLWENEEVALINPLVKLLEQDISEKVQAEAARALGKFALLAEHRKLRDEYKSRLQAVLLDTFSDRNKALNVRRRALESLAPLSLPEVRTAITEAYHSRDARLRISSIYAMGKSCDPAWQPILIEELGNADAEMRYEAAGACAELEDESAVPRLVGLLDDIDTEVQMAAIRALGKIGGPQARKHLAQYLDSPAEAVRKAVEQALREMEADEKFLSYVNLKERDRIIKNDRRR